MSAVNTASVRRVEPKSPVQTLAQAPPTLDAESREWLRCLRAAGVERAEAVARLHALLLRAARFEVARRRATLPHLRGGDLDDIALQSADDALLAVLGK